MVLEFTEEDLKQKINIIEIEDIVIEAKNITVTDDCYLLEGKATIDGEVYPLFFVEFTLEDSITEITCKNLLDANWLEYDFIFN